MIAGRFQGFAPHCMLGLLWLHHVGTVFLIVFVHMDHVQHDGVACCPLCATVTTACKAA